MVHNNTLYFYFLPYLFQSNNIYSLTLNTANILLIFFGIYYGFTNIVLFTSYKWSK